MRPFVVGCVVEVLAFDDGIDVIAGAFRRNVSKSRK